MRVDLVVPLSLGALSAAQNVTVHLDNATFSGTTGTNGTVKFLGIPFAQPPVGDLRFRLPQTVPPYNGSHQAIAFGYSCFQSGMNATVPEGLGPVATAFMEQFTSIEGQDSEDCLTINVWVPAGTRPDHKLPVLFYTYGGGFVIGTASTYDELGSVMVARSVQLGQPIIFIAANYRVNALGFLAGQEVKEAGVGNLGLQDQREALRWTQRYISNFGGDPTKVTIWGLSAGSFSTALQMVSNGGDPESLFRGAIMQSGPPIPTSDMTAGQKEYDELVSSVGCSTAPDTLACLRAVPYDTLKTGIHQFGGPFAYKGSSLVWLPRVDGVFLKENAQTSVANGKVAHIPFIIGDADDEGTLFSLAQYNITTDAEFESYIKENFFPNITDAEMSSLLAAYPSYPPAGSPYDTGFNNTFSPMYKRFSSFFGDLAFQSPRRYLLENIADKQSAWSYLWKRNKDLPYFGSSHASDLTASFAGDLSDYFIRFTVTLTPGDDAWPRWTPDSRDMLQFQDNATAPTVTIKDVYRRGPMEVVKALSLKYRPVV